MSINSGYHIHYNQEVAFEKGKKVTVSDEVFSERIYKELVKQSNNKQNYE
jgi:hypothetical protein